MPFSTHLPHLSAMPGLVALVLMLALWAGGVGQQPLAAQTNKQIRSLQKQQTTIKKDIASNEQLLRSTKKDVTSQLANLQVISAQIDRQSRYVDTIQAEVGQLSATLATLEEQLTRLETDLSECKRKYQRAVTYMFRNRMQTSKWQFILSAKNFRQMYRRLRYVTEFSKFQKAQAQLIRQKEQTIRAKRDEVAGVKKEKNRLMAEGQAQKQQLEGQQRERQQVVDELNKKQKQLQGTLAQQRKKAAQLDARIDQLIKEEIAAAERRRKAEEARKAEAARQAKLKAEREKAAREKAEAARRKAAASGKSGNKGSGKATASSSSKSAKSKTRTEEPKPDTPRFTEADNADRALSGSFAANRGRLPMPITGSYAITTHYGQYNVDGLHGVQLDSKGINITAPAGAQARAVFKGEVTSIFTYGGMYNVIVRHGSYMSVYCNLASTSVRRGQEVSARQILGTVAPDATGNCTLHFQLRKETAKLNPEQWLGR
ncbi:MAG: peptidoglycan DD-metalloendopeptidase family protein [Bacteroidales bacterium]|nr:peptidoglycan DD-metalloendopeptidase family protein [Bacteroidales bacterium]